MAKKEKPQEVAEENQKALSLPIDAEEKAMQALEIKQKIIELYEEMNKLEEGKEGPPLSCEERAMIELWKEQKKKSESPFCFQATDKSKTKNGTKDEKLDLALAGLAAATGSYDLHFGLLLLT